MNCPYCATELNEKYNFCLACNRQVRCIACREMLVPEKAMCFVCGNPLVAQAPAQGAMNEFTLEERQSPKSAYRRFNGRFSDAAAGQVGAMLGATTNVRPLPQKPTIIDVPRAMPQLGAGDDVVLSTPASHEESDPIVAPSPIVSPNAEPMDKARALQYFKNIDDRELYPKVMDFKGKQRKDQQQRFIILYVWAFQEILGKSVPSKMHIFDIAKKAHVYDRNMIKYLEQTTNEFIINIGGKLELNPKGLNKMETILREIDDSTVGDGFVYWDTTKTPQKRLVLNKDDEQRITQWIQMTLNMGAFDIRNLKNATDCAMFALWAITKGLQAESAVKPKMAYLYLTRKYKTVSVKQTSFTNALSREGNANNFKRNAEGFYYLTSQAQAKVETWINGASIPDTQDSEAEGSDNSNDTEENE